VQAATMLILVLAANTAYADFPRLASILARDRFMPRQFMNQGDRLAFSNGILFLTALAGALLVVFRGDTHSLIPLYMVGVFVSFSLSQAGMVMKWRRGREPGWMGHAAWNGFGATLTTLVLLVVAVTKFSEGAWIIVALLPLHVAWFRAVHKHYSRVAAQLSLNDYVTILLPEFVPARWWHHLLHNQRALLIKGALLFRPHIVVTSVPFHLQR
jgi:amino acid transporter